MEKRDFTLVRESTGITKLDDVIGGGLPRPSLIALTGPPGVGTTSFCKKFIVSSLLRGRTVLVVCEDEPLDHFLRHFDSLETFDLEPYIRAKKLMLIDIYRDFTQALGIRDFSDIGSLEGAPLDKIIFETRKRVLDQAAAKARDFNIVLDSFTALSPFIGIRDVHRAVLTAHEVANEGNHVIVLTAHEGTLEGNFVQVLRQYVDGVIRMRMRWVRGNLKRDMIIEKMSFTEIKQPVLQYRITDEGIEIIEDESS